LAGPSVGGLKGHVYGMLARIFTLYAGGQIISNNNYRTVSAKMLWPNTRPLPELKETASLRITQTYYWYYFRHEEPLWILWQGV
jgi:hypothetical protein